MNLTSISIPDSVSSIGGSPPPRSPTPPASPNAPRVPLKPSAENLTPLRELGDSYLINITRGSRQKYVEEFAVSGFDPLPDRAENQQVEARKITDPDDPQSTLVLCRSAQRRLKEVAMISTVEQRFLKDSGRL